MNKVVLLPGHGGFDSGSCNQINGVRECDGNLSVSLKLKELLEYNNFKVAISRTTDIACGGATNSNQDVNNQIYFANNSGADIAIAIHFNGSLNTTAHGIETLYSQYNGFTKENIKLSTLLLEELVSITGLSNRGIKDSGKSVGVVRAIKIPVSLTECAFVTNPKEYIWCSNPDRQIILAKAHAKAVCKYFKVEYKEENTEEEDNMVRYNKLSDIPNEWKFRDIIEILMNAKIINGDGSDQYGNDDVINLSEDQVRSLIFIYKGGGFDKKLIAEGLEPAVG